MPQTLEELERMNKNNPVLPGFEDVIPTYSEQADPLKAEGDMIKDRIITMINDNPHKASLIVRDWLHSAAKNAYTSDVSKASENKEQARTA